MCLLFSDKNGGYKSKMDAAKAMDGNYYNQWRQEFNDAVKDIRGDKPKNEPKVCIDNI